MGYFSSSITPEREKELIERTARWIVDHGLSDVAELLLTGYGTTGLLGNMAFFQFYPFAVAFLKQSERELMELMTLDATKNSKLIIERVKQLEAERKLLGETSTPPTKSHRESYWNKLSSTLSRRIGRVKRKFRKPEE